MSHPCLLFCPYISLPQWLHQPVEFAVWELGPPRFFEDRWADARFEEKAKSFLYKFVGPYSNEEIEPAILCREGKQLDGQKPSDEELRALELSLAFASIDRNPRRRNFEETDNKKQEMRTTENAELHLWSVGDGNVTINTGYLIPNCIVDATANPVMRPPLDLHIPSLAPSPDPQVLTGIYETVLGSLRSPGENSTADKIRVAVEWLAKAWTNSQAVQWPERLVYLKTAFEALTGTSTSWKSARKLREIFEALPHTTDRDSEILVWSPEEEPVHSRTWVDKNGQHQSTHITDLEHWFIEFGEARNSIIHNGELPEPTYSGSNPTYSGPFIFTAEFLLRGVIKVLLSELGYENARRPEIW